jgi:transcriptional regulator with XRE-family HTH domain
VDAVKEIRRRKGWSQKDLAEESGVGQDTISGIESGRHEPRPSTLRKLANALDVEVADFFREPAVPLAEAPREAGPQEVGSSEAPSPSEVETEAEEWRITPQSAESLKGHIERMKELRELREAEIEKIRKSIGPRNARLLQMEMADKGLRALLEELGVLAFAEGVKAGRVMADPKAIPLCHELLRRLVELEALSAEARGLGAAVSSDIHEEGVKGMSEIERQMQEGTLERRGTES